MNNEIAVKEKSKELSWSKSQIELIKRTVAKGSTDDEFNMYMYLAKTYQLDPIIKEIWFIKYNDKAVPIIMTSRDGYLSIANRNPHYQGLNSDVVHENDEFEKVEGGVKHKYDCKDRGKIIGAYALGYRDDRKHPVYVFAHYSEYFKKNSSIWIQYGSAMILKVAEAMMLKRLFSISGLVTKEEIAIEKEDGTISVGTKREVKDEVSREVKEMPFDPQDKGQVTEYEEEIIDNALDQKVNRNDEAIEEAEVIEEEKAKKQAEKDLKPASQGQIDYIYGFKNVKGEWTKGIVESTKIIKPKEIDRIGKRENLSFEKADKILKWWWGDKDKNIVGEREKREKNPKTGESDLERRSTLMREVLTLMKKNYIYKSMQKKFYKKFKKDEIKQLTTEELITLKGELEHYVPDWK